ncbi:MAG: MBL fold metallo-hydrolase [Planctomycetales bacterium]|nr:MBL fold metallo-hydrolase [Planctomycetales bacterium]
MKTQTISEKHFLNLCMAGFILLCSGLTTAENKAAPPADPNIFEKDVFRTQMGELTITFIGHGTLLFECGGKVIHVDPWTNLADYSKLPDADLILITHEHQDHLDPKAIEQIRQESTVILLPKACADKVAGGQILANGQSTEVAGLKVEAIAAYNIEHKRPDGIPYHPKGQGNGYLLTFDKMRVYVGGDTENTPEMKALKEIDIAFLPMNLPYTMTPGMAADAAKVFKPKVLYPYHYGQTDVNELRKLMGDVGGIEIRIRKMQ